jgi:ketosteroid isomerase-like protein
MLRTARRLIPCFVLLAATGAAGAVETAGPIEVVEKAYVDGVHRNADAETMRAGFHPEFVMFVKTGDGGVRQVTLDEWAGRIAEAGAHPDRQTPNIEAELELVGETDDAAVVRVELKRDGRHVFTDFLSLYRTADGWKIVGKIYQDRR